MQVPSVVPSHIAVILDGNRRWSSLNNTDEFEGHLKGAQKFEKFLDWCLDANIKTVSAYVLSMENLVKRSKNEIKGLMELFCKFITKWLQPGGLVDKYQINVNFIGNLNLLPKRVTDLITKMRSKTKNYKKKYVNIMIAYSAKEEIASAFKNVMKIAMKKGKMKVTPKMIEKNLSVKNPVDLVIRTGGNSRLSNFLIWQTAYAEMFTTKKLWPDFTKREFEKSLSFFADTKRNFGV